jgi:hypothetical protein
MNQRQENLRNDVTKWVLYMADLGAVDLYIDECPTAMTKHDQRGILDWLEEEGFKVSRKTPMRRAQIHLR